MCPISISFSAFFQNVRFGQFECKYNAALLSLGGTQGQAADIAIHAKRILHTRDIINKILADRTGQSLKKISADTDRDFFMDAEEALKYGIIDKVIAKRKA